MFKPTNADDKVTLNHTHMKKTVKLLAGLFLLVVMYFIASDGMMIHFGLSQGIQYAFNMGSIVILIPAAIFTITNCEEAKS